MCGLLAQIIMKVKDVMVTELLCVREKDFATYVRKLFRDYDYRSFPVIDDDNKLVGVITRGDILNITSTRSNILVSGLMSQPVYFTTSDESLTKVAEIIVKNNVGRMQVIKSTNDRTLIGMISTHDILKKFIEKEPNKKFVRDVMTEDVKSCSPYDEITKIWDKMLETGFSGIPVVKKGKLIGIITRIDIIRSGHVRISREGDKGKVRRSTAVGKIMKTPIISVQPDTPTIEAAKIVIEKNIGRLPVLDDEKLVGIVDREDLIKAWF